MRRISAPRCASRGDFSGPMAGSPRSCGDVRPRRSFSIARRAAIHATRWATSLLVGCGPENLGSLVGYLMLGAVAQGAVDDRVPGFATVGFGGSFSEGVGDPFGWLGRRRWRVGRGVGCGIRGAGSR